MYTVILCNNNNNNNVKNIKALTRVINLNMKYIKHYVSQNFY